MCERERRLRVCVRLCDTESAPACVCVSCPLPIVHHLSITMSLPLIHPRAHKHTYTGLEVLKRIPLAAADNAKHLQLLSWFVNKVQLMQPGHMLILPGGWVVRAPPKVSLECWA